jgi:alpha-tubulin suppressor-like RCC1 family protein
MLEKDPQARWPSMRDVMSTLGPTPPPDDPVWAQATSLATGQNLAVDPESKTWETPLPRPASRSLMTSVTQWFRPRRRRYALGGAAAVTAAAVVLFIGFPRTQAASIGLSDTALNLTPGDTAPVQAVVLDADGDTLASAVQWTTEDGAVASVTDDGHVVALGEGTTRIRARAGGIETALVVSVAGTLAGPGPTDGGGPTGGGGADEDRPGRDDAVIDATGLRVDLARTSVRVGDSLRPTVAFLGQGNQQVGTATGAAFSTDDPRVMHVSRSGWIVAVGAGTTQLQARAGRLQARAALSVVPIVPTLSTVSAGAEHTCGIATDGTVFCWGRNDRGQVVPGLAPQQLFPFPRGGPFAAVSAGGAHSCALQRDQSIRCWGGLAAPAGRFRFLTAGMRHACAIMGNGFTACWGANDRGQLGDGTTGTRTVGQTVQGDLSFEMIAAGADHTCGLLGGRVFCWGDDASGQTGTGTLDRGFVPQPTEVEGDHGYLAFVAAGTNHTCVLTRTGTALCWGANDYGQLGDGSKQARHAPRPVRAPMRGARGAALTFEMVSAGENHTCGVTKTQRVYCWGDNRFGQIGDGTTDGRVVPVRVGVDAAFVSVSAGRAPPCAVSASGDTWCWGANGGGQLGDGTSTNRTTPVTPGEIAGAES